jgi:hypothetical protein
MTTPTETKTCQIKCINKSDRFNPHERITNIGGYPRQGDGEQFVIVTREQVEQSAISLKILNSTSSRSGAARLATHQRNGSNED